MTATACGSHLSHREIVAAQSGGGSGGLSSGAKGASAAGDLSGITGQAGTAGDTGANTAALGDTGTGPGGEGPVGGGPSAAGASADACGGAPCAPIIIGSVGSYSGITGQTVGTGVKGLQAWVASINAKGGLGGHEVQLVVGDDGGDPAKDRALVQEFVEEKGVVAFVYNAASLAGQASVDYLTEKRIPVLGADGSESWFLDSPMFFPQTTAGDRLWDVAAGGAQWKLNELGITKVGVISCSDGIQVCEDGRRVLPQAAPKFGQQVVYNGQGSLAQPDYTANCLAAQSAGAQFIYVVLDGNSLQRLARSCANANYRPLYSVGQQIQLDTVAQDPNLQGSIGTTVVASPYGSGNPAVDEFRAAMAQYSPDTSLSGSPVLGWSSGKMLEAAAQRLSNPPTSDDILNGLWSLNGNDLNGLVLPLQFTKDQNASPPACWWEIIINDKAYQSANDGQRHCAP